MIKNLNNFAKFLKTIQSLGVLMDGSKLLPWNGMASNDDGQQGQAPLGRED